MRCGQRAIAVGKTHPFPQSQPDGAKLEVHADVCDRFFVKLAFVAGERFRPRGKRIFHTKIGVRLVGIIKRERFYRVAAFETDALHHAFKRRHVHTHLDRKTRFDVVDVAFADHVRVGRKHNVRLETHDLSCHLASRILHPVHAAVVKRQKRNVRYTKQLCRGERFRLANLHQFVAKQLGIDCAHASVGEDEERNMLARLCQLTYAWRAGDFDIVRMRADEEIALERVELRNRGNAFQNRGKHEKSSRIDPL